MKKSVEEIKKAMKEVNEAVSSNGGTCIILFSLPNEDNFNIAFCGHKHLQLGFLISAQQVVQKNIFSTENKTGWDK